jgi:acetoacetate decarboxylase
MPAHFGGWDFNPEGAAYMRNSTALSIRYVTDKQKLERFIPEGFELLAPELSISYTALREIDWMMGGFYNLVQVDVPVRFKGKRDQLDGRYVLVIWENRTAPILSGREESGMPKIYADIQDLHAIPPNYFTNASFDGYTFLKMNFRGATEVPKEQVEAMKASMSTINAIGWRFIPKVDGRGADLSQFVLYPQGFELARAWTGEGAVQWIELTMEENPRQFYIINALAELPIIEVRPASMAKGVYVLKPMQARLLE